MTPAIGQRVWYTDKQGRGHLAIVGGVHYIRDEVTTVNLATHMDAPVLYNVPYSPEYAPNSYADKEPPQAAPVQPAQDRPAVPPHKLTLGAVVWFTDVDGRGQEARVTALQWGGPRSTPTARLSVGNRDVDDVKYSPIYLPRSFHPVAPQSRAPHHSCGPTMRERARDENAWRKRRREMGWPVDGRGHRPVGPIGGPPPGEPLLAQYPQVAPPSGMRDAQGNPYPPAGGRLETPGGMPLEVAHRMAPVSSPNVDYPLARYVDEWAHGLNKARNAVNHLRSALPDGDPARYFLDPPLNDLQRLSHALAMVKARLRERTAPLLRREPEMSDRPSDVPDVPIGTVVSYTPIPNMEAVAMDGTRNILTAPGPYRGLFIHSNYGKATLRLMDHKGKPMGIINDVPYSTDAAPGTWCVSAEPAFHQDILDSLREENKSLGSKLGKERQVQEERERQYAESLHDKDTRIAQLTSYLEKNTAVMAQDAETIKSLQDKLRHPASSRPVLAHHIDWDSLYLTDGGGGGEPDTISLGHDAEGTWRSAEIAGYQGTDAREHLEYVLKVARGIGAALDALLGE